MLGRGETDKATDTIIKAFKLNPNLRTDLYAIGVAIEVTGLDKKGIYKLVAKGREPKEKGKNTTDRPRERRKPEKDAWFPNVFEAIGTCVLCFIAWTVMVSAASIVFINSVNSGFEAYETVGCAGCSAVQQATLNEHMAHLTQFRDLTAQDFVPFAALVAATTVGLAILFVTVMHYVANHTFDGLGYYRPTLAGGMMFLGDHCVYMGAVGGLYGILQ